MQPTPGGHQSKRKRWQRLLRVFWMLARGVCAEPVSKLHSICSLMSRTYHYFAHTLFFCGRTFHRLFDSGRLLFMACLLKQPFGLRPPLVKPCLEFLHPHRDAEIIPIFNIPKQHQKVYKNPHFCVSFPNFFLHPR